MDDTKYRMTLAYDGSSYSGWQIQPRSPSIQGKIEQILALILRHPVRVIGAGRTDAGVHALGQAAHFSTNSPYRADQILDALNGMLPPDIRVKELLPTSDDFHAQISARMKIYHYHLWLERVIDPFVSRYRHHYCYSNFSLSSLKEAVRFFLGTHDFATFANVGGNISSTIRTIYRLDIIPEEGGIRLEFQGDGFLYKMVRNIVGTLLEIAIGKKMVSDIPNLLNAKDRRAAGPTAPPKGLFLVKVYYDARFLNGITLRMNDSGQTASSMSDVFFGSHHP